MLTLTSRIFEHKLLQIYSSVTEQFDWVGKITEATPLAWPVAGKVCTRTTVCDISVLLEVGCDDLTLPQSFWH